MENNKTEKYQIPKLQCAIVILAITALIIGYSIRLSEEIATLLQVADSPAAIRLYSYAVPLAVIMPALAFIVYTGLCAILGTITPKLLINTTKFLFVSFPVFLVTWAIYSFFLSGWLQEIGYEKCYWYTSSTYRSPIVWVKSNDVCFKEGALVRSDLLKWMKLHTDLTPKQVAEKIDTLVQERGYNNL